ncbi:MAG: hypothetical protein IPP12_22630 [Nitrospira sp.]|nr:hypothetical protein [Nitrospira sp.]
MAKPKAEKQFKVARSVAEDEFERWTTALGLDHKFDEDFAEPNSLKLLSIHRNVVVRAIMYGHAVVNEKCELVFTPQHSPSKDALTFRRPRGSDYKLMDTANGGASRNMTFLASLTGQNDIVFDQMDMIYDGDFCSSVVALFLG